VAAATRAEPAARRHPPGSGPCVAPTVTIRPRRSTTASARSIKRSRRRAWRARSPSRRSATPPPRRQRSRRWSTRARSRTRSRWSATPPASSDVMRSARCTARSSWRSGCACTAAAPCHPRRRCAGRRRFRSAPRTCSGSCPTQISRSPPAAGGSTTRTSGPARWISWRMPEWTCSISTGCIPFSRRASPTSCLISRARRRSRTWSQRR